MNTKKKHVQVGTITLNESIKRNLPSSDAYGWRSVVEIEAGTYPMRAEIEGGSLELKASTSGIVVDNYAPYEGKQTGDLDDLLGKSWPLPLTVHPAMLQDPRFNIEFDKEFVSIVHDEFVLDAEHPDFREVLLQGRRHDFEAALGLNGFKAEVSADYSPAFAERAGYLEEPKLSEGFELGSAWKYMQVIAMDKVLRNYAGKTLDEMNVSIADAHAYTKGKDGSFKSIAAKAARELMDDRHIPMAERAQELDR